MQSDQAVSYNDDAIQELAVAVLKKAVEEGDLEDLEFWCDVVGLNQALFLKKAEKTRLRRP